MLKLCFVYNMKIKDIFKWVFFIDFMLLIIIVVLFVLEESMIIVELNGDFLNFDFLKLRYVVEGLGMEFFLCYIWVKLNVLLL